MSDRAPTFAMFCTIDENAFLFAVVADEIEAVRAYSRHVETFPNSDHRPHIHMEPMQTGWEQWDHRALAEINPARNLFRQPAEAAPCA